MSFDHFSAIAPIYARVSYSKKEVMREFADLPVSGRLLDVGGGTGRVANVLRDFVDEIVIADISFGMLAHSQRTQFRPVCGLSEQLPFANNSFERIIMVDALHHVFDQAASIREMLRVLKPGGLMVIEEPDIRHFGVKLIALAEKLLLMRTHFLAAEAIMDLCKEGSRKNIERDEDGTAWVIVRK